MALENAPQEPVAPGHHRGRPVCWGTEPAGRRIQIAWPTTSFASGMIEPRAAPWWTPCASPWMPTAAEHRQGQDSAGGEEQAVAGPHGQIQPQTRTLDKYLSLDTLPKAPRWKTVVASAESCSSSAPERGAAAEPAPEHQRLRQLASPRADEPARSRMAFILLTE